MFIEQIEDFGLACIQSLLGQCWTHSRSSGSVTVDLGSEPVSEETTIPIRDHGERESCTKGGRLLWWGVKNPATPLVSTVREQSS